MLPALLDHLGIVRPLLIGHSDGASIALLHAGAGHPVAGLVLLAPHVFVEDALDRRDRRRARGVRQHRSPGAAWPATTSTPTPRSAAGTTSGCRPAFRSWDITDRLAAVDVPILVVQGTDDEYGTLAQLDAIEHGVGGPVTRLVLPGAGHAPHLDAPAATLTAVATFVNAF